VVHIIRTGRNQLWLWAVVLLPVAGSAAYVLAEVLPEAMGSRGVRKAQAGVVQLLDPERELRATRDSLALADTAFNRLRLADAYAALGRLDEALPLYEQALVLAGGDDARLAIKTARSAFEAGDTARARALLDRTPPLSTAADQDRRMLLDARVREATGDLKGALPILRDVATRLAGDEARCRLAGVLIALDRPGEVRPVLEEVAARAKRLTARQRAPEKDMYAWAAARLAEMRG